MCNNTQKKKAAGAGKDFTLFFGVMLHFNFKCVNKVENPSSLRLSSQYFHLVKEVSNIMS